MGRWTVLVVAAGLVGGVLSVAHGVALDVLVASLLCAIAPFRATTALRTTAIIALAAGVVLGATRVPAAYDAGRHTVVVSGIVVDEPRADSFGSTFPLLREDGATLEVAAAGPPPQVGAHLVVRGRLEAFDLARNPGEPSPRALAAERRLTARLSRGRILSATAPDWRDEVSWIPRLRSWASGALRAHVEEPEASILAGAMWGERGTLPPDLRGEFQDTGTVHILVTAGLHLGVVAALIAWLLGLAGCGRFWSSLLGIGAVWLYAGFSGGHLPSLRAATMISFGLLARAAGRGAVLMECPWCRRHRDCLPLDACRRLAVVRPLVFVRRRDPAVCKAHR